MLILTIFNLLVKTRWPISSQRLWKTGKSGLYLILTVTVTLIVALFSQPVQALQAQITPPNPQLGDTISVVINLAQNPSSNPTVTLKDKTYPAFPLENGQWRTFLPSTPLDQPGNWPIKITTDGEVQDLSIRVGDRNFPTQSIWLPPGKDNLQGTDHEFDLVKAFKNLSTPKKYWNGPFQRPNNGEITTIYGVRRYYNGEFAEDYYHRGIDYAGDYGSPILAPAAGKVMLVGREADGFEIHGNVVGLDHGQGVTSLYLHLSKINVREGDLVTPGQVIGALGDSGAATGPHLHWGLYVQGQSVDPVPWRYNTIE
jgi:murein DD-endopeptidase MepM/ murein hydrolase activator NlpD